MKTKYSIYPCVLLVIMMLFFILMNIMIPFYGDDYAFMYTPSGKRIQTFLDVINSTATMWMSWNGRILPNLLGYTFPSFLSESVFDLLNALIYFLTIICIVLFLWHRWNKVGIIGITVLLIGLFYINRDDVFYWCTGSVNYLWPLPFFILLLFLAEQTINDKIKLPVWIVGILSFFLSLTHEVYIMPLCGALGILLLHRLFSRKVSLELIIICIGCFGGLAVIMLSPGVFARFSNTTDATGSILVFFAKVFFRVLLELRIFYLMIIISLMLRLRNKEEYNRFIRENILLYLITFLGLVPAVMTSSGGRVLICTELASLLIVSKLLQGFSNIPLFRRVCVAMGGCLICLLAFVSYRSYFNWKAYRGSVSTYLAQDSSTVLVDDSHNFASRMIPGYIMNLDLFYDGFVKKRLAKEKSKLFGRSCDVMQQLPLSVFNILEDEGTFFCLDNKIMGNAEFYENDKCRYYIARFTQEKYEKILEGCLSIKRSMPIIGKKMYVNVLRDEIVDITMPVVFVDLDNNRRYIILRKDYKNYPFTNIDEINIYDIPGIKKFELK